MCCSPLGMILTIGALPTIVHGFSSKVGGELILSLGIVGQTRSVQSPDARLLTSHFGKPHTKPYTSNRD